METLDQKDIMLSTVVKGERATHLTDDPVDPRSVSVVPAHPEVDVFEFASNGLDEAAMLRVGARSSMQKAHPGPREDIAIGRFPLTGARP